MPPVDVVFEAKTILNSINKSERKIFLSTTKMAANYLIEIKTDFDEFALSEVWQVEENGNKYVEKHCDMVYQHNFYM